MKKFINLITCIITCILVFSSCLDENYLELAPTNKFGEDEVFSKFEEADKFMKDIYTNMPNMDIYRQGRTYLECYTDNMQSGRVWSNSHNIKAGDVMYCGEETQLPWYWTFGGVRKINIMMKHLNANDIPIPSNYNSAIPVEDVFYFWRGECHFLRAFLLFDSMKRFGGLPIFENVLTTSKEDLVPRSKFDETVTYIVQQCDSAIKYAPLNWSTTRSDNYSRATKGAAYALKSRALLYAASPLFNNPTKPENTYEHGAYSKEKWKKVIDATTEWIKHRGNEVEPNQNYSLYPLFEKNLIVQGLTNPEMILVRQYASTTGVISELTTPYRGGSGELQSISQNFVDKFEIIYTNNAGKELSVYVTDPSKEIIIDGKKVYDPQNPYNAKRDSRFNFTVGYNGSKWPGGGGDLQLFDGGNDRQAPFTTPACGYVGFKYSNKYANSKTGVSSAIYNTRPYFRFAEAFYNLAEAINEYYGSNPTDPNIQIAYDCLNLVRGGEESATIADEIFSKRTDLNNPKVDKVFVENLFRNYVASEDLYKRELKVSNFQEKFRTFIQYNRTVEFVMEEHSYYDYRRWKTAEQLLSNFVYGVRITKNNAGVLSYTYDKVGVMTFDTKIHYLNPIPYDEIYRYNNKNEFPQNSGW